MMNFEQKERIDFVIRRFQEIIEKYDEIQKMIVVFTQQIDEIKATKPKDEENFKRLEQNLSSLSDKHEQKSALCRQDFDRHENNISSLSEVQKLYLLSLSSLYLQRLHWQLLLHLFRLRLLCEPFFRLFLLLS